MPTSAMNAVAFHPPQSTSTSDQPSPFGNLADDFKGRMAPRSISELANWDGCLDQQHQNTKWCRSSSIHTRDSYQTSLDPEISQPSVTVSPGKRRAEKYSFRSSLGSASMTNTTNTRLPSRVHTTSTPLSDTHADDHSSISTRPRPPSSPSLLSISSLSSPIFSALPFHVNNSRIRPLPRHVTSSASTLESEVIDLTLEDTENEVSLSKELVPITTHLNNRSAHPAPHRQPSSSTSSSPILPEQSLFTPPPPSRKRTRLVIDYLQVPPFPNGLTKADYQPILHCHDMPPSGSTVSNIHNHAPCVKSPVTRTRTYSPQKRKGKKHEPSDLSSDRKHKLHLPAIGTDLTPNKLLDAFYEPTEVPLYDDDTYPPLTTWDLATNTRFQFAHSLRAHASKLHEAELSWAFNPRILGKASIWARSSEATSPHVLGTTGYVSIEHLRPWELVPPKESSEQISDGEAHARETLAVVGADSDHISLPIDVLPGPSTAVGPALSNPPVLQPYSSAVVNTENDMNQYFNGLGDSPNKHAPHQQLAPTNTFRSHLLHFVGRPDTDSFDFESASLTFDSRLADTSGHECFLGVPPSPTTAEMVASTVPEPVADPPFGSSSHVTASPSSMFTANGPFIDVWAFEQGECLPLEDKSPLGNDVPAAPTINPSLLGQAQPEAASVIPKHTSKRRSKLPEPVIYIRRPVGSSALPVVPGKRPVRIKYRDPGVSSASPSIRKSSNDLSLNYAENPTGSSTSDTDESVLTKRRSVPSRKLREAYAASESDSDFIPGTTRSETKPTVKRRSLEGKELAAQRHDSDDETVPTMSYCHQCRNKSVRPKMLCSNMVERRACGKRFCNRCVLYRYPDITFDEHSAGFLCPVCTNTCNCSYCSRNRGEEFISMRLGGLAASIFKSKVTLVRDPNAGSPDKGTQRDRSSALTSEPEQSKFWAHVYGMEGERVGSAFMTQDQIEHLRAPSGFTSVSAPPPLKLPETQSQSQPRHKARKVRRQEKKLEKPIGPRVFIGRPLASWKIRAARDLELSADMNVSENADAVTTGKGKGKARRCRWYVGKPAALFEPYGRMPGSGLASPMSRSSTPGPCSDGTLTPLSELAADDWPQPEVGECCEWAPRGVSAGMGATAGYVASDFRDIPRLMAGQLDGGADVGSEVMPDMVPADKGAPSMTLSEQDLARAISTALAALAEPPCPR